ncbi:MAG: polyprenyl synthetase family protein [Clostridia bacterium]|nr:polyprenyl synthetase family protein [Clostridia bacterium]
MNVAEVLAQKAATVETALQTLFCEPELAPRIRLNESLRYSIVGGGKRLRPVLLLSFAELGGLDPITAMDFACAIELIHTYSLIHDDLPCMDNSDLRRGRPASHCVFGEAGAVLAGDGLLNAAFETMLSSNAPIPAECKLAAAAELGAASGRLGMIAGQVIDIENEQNRVSPTAEDLTRLCRLKTGAIIKGACVAGLKLAGVTDPQKLAAAASYADALGLAFQIRDDMLDVESSAEVMGKSVGHDAENGKVTFVTLLGMDACRAEVDRLTAEAVKALDAFGGDEFLVGLAEMMARRDH